MKTYRIFYRVPACQAHCAYLSETMVEAVSKADAASRFAASYSLCTIHVIFNGI